jgi:16S rRNA (guanine527-N7)-methyltransferase
MTSGATLAAGIAALDLDVDAAAQAKLLRYIELLGKWNRTHNLTAVREPERMITHHLLDALAILPHLSQAADQRLIDVGSGGGVPGIPLAVARPGWRVTLLDSNRKKTAFLRQAVAELVLPNVEIVTSRVEDYVPPIPFDVAISRAFSDLSRFASAASPLVRSGGHLIAMKGTYPRGELESLPPGTRVVAVPVLEIPSMQAQRHLVIMTASPA